jgi:hypothetical protein
MYVEDRTILYGQLRLYQKGFEIAGERNVLMCFVEQEMRLGDMEIVLNEPFTSTLHRSKRGS